MKKPAGFQEYDGYSLPERKTVPKQEIEKIKKESAERMKKIKESIIMRT